MRKKSGLILLLLSIYIFLSLLPFTPNAGGDFGEILRRFMFKEIGRIYSFSITFFLFILSIYLLKPNFDSKLLITLSIYFFLLPFGIFFIFEGLLEKNTKTFLLYSRISHIFGRYYPPITIFVVLLIPLIPYLKKLKLKKPKIKLPEKGKKIKVKAIKKEKKKEKKKERKVKEEFREIKIEKSKLFEIFKTEEIKSELKKQELEEEARKIKEKLEEFGIKGEIKEIHPGPFITLYEFEPEKGIQIKRIKNLAEDLALRMKSSRVRIVAPLPDKGTVGIEVPNRKVVTLRIGNIIHSKDFIKTKGLTIPLGITTDGYPYYTDLTKMPHLLIAGATGSGKSVCISSIIVSLILKNEPDRLKFLLLDPKRVELSRFEGIPYLLTNVITDRKQAIEILKLATRWMEERYKILAKEGVRDIESYNRKKDRKMAYIVIIIDEFADLMFTERNKIEYYITRLAQMARAVGIHLVIATQRPSVDVVTGTIKANFPVRVAFRLPSLTDSRTILDTAGAEKLLGSGDMLFIPPGKAEPIRLHGPFVSDDEIDELVRTLTIPYFMKKFYEVTGKKIKTEEMEILYERGFIPFITGHRKEGRKEIMEQIFLLLTEYFDNQEEFEEKIESLRENYYEKLQEISFEELGEEGIEAISIEGKKFDALIKEAAEIVVSNKKASATLLQRKLNIGFPRAAKIIDQLEELGIIGPSEGSKPRKVLISPEELERIFKA